MADTLLKIRGLRKSFGAVMATVNLDLDVQQGEILAIIGPNGAGKTTLIAQIAGELRPDGGTIHFAGINITSFSVHRRSVLGVGRSFQITSVFRELSVLDNVALAVQAHAGHSFRFWRNARTIPELREPAMQILEQAGLIKQAHTMTAHLSHGEQRQVEIAMVLATRPTLLLLDEPTAGMGAKASKQMVEMLNRLKRERTLLLVEHDMETVSALADRISVLVYGRIITTGTMEEIRSNPEVRKAYLGDEQTDGKERLRWG